MNYVGIDPSLISTGLCVNDKLFNYTREEDATTKKGGLSKWFKRCETDITYRYISFGKYESYSEGEITKLCDYETITDMIIDDILANIDHTVPTKVGIEGYSYSSDAGSIIDLVTFSTLLRSKLYSLITDDITVLSPTSLKLESAKLTYPVEMKGKKEVYRNNYGIAGGSFTKREMYLAIVENKTFTDGYATLLRSLQGDVMDMTTIKKPMEDVNDAYLLHKVMQMQ
jgi:hypothetical protein